MRRAIITLAAVALGMATPALAAPTATAPGTGIGSWVTYSSLFGGDFADFALSGTFPMGGAKPFVGEVKQINSVPVFGKRTVWGNNGYVGRSGRFDIIGVPTVGAARLTGWCIATWHETYEDPLDNGLAAGLLQARCKTFRAGVEHDVHIVVTTANQTTTGAHGGAETSHTGPYVAYAVS